MFLNAGYWGLAALPGGTRHHLEAQWHSLGHLLLFVDKK